MSRLSIVRMLASSSEDLSACTVVQLKERLRAARLPVSGRKSELIARLEAAAPKATVLEAIVPTDASLAHGTSAFPTVAIEACKS